jgi:hypothetical protein
VQVFEHQDHRVDGRLRGEELLPRAGDLVAHELGVAARGAQLHVVALAARGADVLGEKQRDPRDAGPGHVPRDPRAQLLPLDGDGLAVEDARGPADHLREHAKGGPRAHRIAGRQPHLHPLGAALDRPERLVADARLPDTGRPLHQHGPRHLVGDALGEDALYLEQLALAADARGGLAEQEAGGVLRGAFALQVEGPGLARDDEARVEEARADFVDQDGARPRRRGGSVGLAAEELERAVDGVAHGHALGQDRTAGDQHQGDPRRREADRERTARGADRLVGGAGAAREGGEQLAARERLELCPERGHGEPESAGQRR